MKTDPYQDLPDLSKEELIQAAYEMIGGNLGDLDNDQLLCIFTIATHVFDLCLNEIEGRGILAFVDDGTPILPYCSDHGVETVLTREVVHG